MTFLRLANAKLVIRPLESGDADEFVRAAHESIETEHRARSRDFLAKSTLLAYLT